MAYVLKEPPRSPRPAAPPAPSGRAPGRPALRPENRVWGSPRFSNKTRLANTQKPKQPRRETTPCAYDFAPGVRVGPNLYAFVGNNPLNWWDRLGLKKVWVPLIEGAGADYDDLINQDPSIHNKTNVVKLDGEYVDGKAIKGNVFATFKVGAWFTATNTSFKAVGAAQIHRWGRPYGHTRVNLSDMRFLNYKNLRIATVKGGVSCDQDDGRIIISPAGLSDDQTSDNVNAAAIFRVLRDSADSKSAIVHMEAAASFLYDMTVTETAGITIGGELGLKGSLKISGEASSSTTIESKVFKSLKKKRSLDIPYRCKCIDSADLASGHS